MTFCVTKLRGRRWDVGLPQSGVIVIIINVRPNRRNPQGISMKNPCPVGVMVTNIPLTFECKGIPPTLLIKIPRWLGIGWLVLGISITRVIVLVIHTITPYIYPADLHIVLGLTYWKCQTLENAYLLLIFHIIS